MTENYTLLFIDDLVRKHNSNCLCNPVNNSYSFLKKLLPKNHITASCTINNGQVRKNRSLLFENNAPLPSFLLSLYQNFQLNYPKFYKMDNLSKLGLLTTEILLKGSFVNDDYKMAAVGIILANANSSLDDDLKYYDTVKDGASPSLFVYTLPNIVIGEICIKNQFKGEHAFFIQETFDSNFLEQQVTYLLDNNIQQCCICGWIDVLQMDYKAVLFLVEKKKKGNAVLFSAKNMDNIFNKE